MGATDANESVRGWGDLGLGGQQGRTSFVSLWLCGLEQVTSFLWVSVSSTVKWVCPFRITSVLSRTSKNQGSFPCQLGFPLGRHISQYLLQSLKWHLISFCEGESGG